MTHKTKPPIVDVDHLSECLPHGSGIDCAWRIETLQNGNVVARNSFHLMDENGYYCGWQDFAVRLFVYKGDIGYKVQLTGYRHRCNAAYALRDYLADAIDYALSASGFAA